MPLISFVLYNLRMNIERETGHCSECGEPLIDKPDPIIDDERPQVKRIGALGVGGLLISGITAGIGVGLGYTEVTVAGGIGAGVTTLSALIAEVKAHRRYDRLNRKL